MIARLTGRLVEKAPTGSVVDVGGVGYHALHSLTTFEDLPEVGGTVTLLTHLHVREDALQLYGFSRARGARRVRAPALGLGRGAEGGARRAVGLSPLRSRARWRTRTWPR